MHWLLGNPHNSVQHTKALPFGLPIYSVGHNNAMIIVSLYCSVRYINAHSLVIMHWSLGARTWLYSVQHNNNALAIA